MALETPSFKRKAEKQIGEGHPNGSRKATENRSQKGNNMSQLFDNHITLLSKSLDFRSHRNALLGGNIANVETPGYKAKDLVFEQALGNAMRAQEPGPLQVSDPRHMDGQTRIALGRVSPTVIDTANPEGTLDGNTVNLETEMAKLGENQVAYQALTQMTIHKFQLLKTAIRNGDV